MEVIVTWTVHCTLLTYNTMSAITHLARNRYEWGWTEGAELARELSALCLLQAFRLHQTAWSEDRAGSKFWPPGLKDTDHPDAANLPLTAACCQGSSPIPITLQENPSLSLAEFNPAADNWALNSHSLTPPLPPAGWGGEMDKRGNSWVEIKTV